MPTRVIQEIVEGETIHLKVTVFAKLSKPIRMCGIFLCLFFLSLTSLAVWLERMEIKVAVLNYLIFLTSILGINFLIKTGLGWFYLLGRVEGSRLSSTDLYDLTVIEEPLNQEGGHVRMLSKKKNPKLVIIHIPIFGKILIVSPVAIIAFLMGVEGFYILIFAILVMLSIDVVCEFLSHLRSNYDS